MVNQLKKLIIKSYCARSSRCSGINIIEPALENYSIRLGGMRLNKFEIENSNFEIKLCPESAFGGH